MSHITEIALENYCSFREAQCRLSPFTLIVGANNSGKTNLLKAVRTASVFDTFPDPNAVLQLAKHHASSADAGTKIALRWNDVGVVITDNLRMDPAKYKQSIRKTIEALDKLNPRARRATSPPQIKQRKFAAPLEIYRLDPNLIGRGEGGADTPYIDPSGVGVAWLLDKWNAGARSQRARFEQVVAALRHCVPEIEALSFYDEDVGKRAIQVEQTGLPEPVPLTELSDGTRLVLALLTLVNQETPPPVLLLEDIDRGLHPRLYEQLVAFLRTLAAEGRTQILATTHDPYLIDEFRDTPEAVVIVEKKDGASTLSNLDERLAVLRDAGADLEMPLGQVWFSGMVGGVPAMKLPEILKSARQ